LAQLGQEEVVDGLSADTGVVEGGVGPEDVLHILVVGEVSEAEQKDWRVEGVVLVGDDGPLEGADERGPRVVVGGGGALMLEIGNPGKSGGLEHGGEPVVHGLFKMRVRSQQGSVRVWRGARGPVKSGAACLRAGGPSGCPRVWSPQGGAEGLRRPSLE